MSPEVPQPVDPMTLPIRTKMSPRKLAIRDLADRLAPERRAWKDKNRAYYDADLAYMRHLIPEGASILDLGCGPGDLLAALKPSVGVGVDFSEQMIREAREAHADLSFHHADVETISEVREIEGPFDYIILSDTVGSLDDVQATFGQLHEYCHRDTRIVVAYYANFWEPALRLAEMVGGRMPQVPQNWLSTTDTGNIFDLAGFDVVKREWRQLIPYRLLGVGTVINRYFATLPFIRRLCLRNYLVARSMQHAGYDELSATVLVPCRNEKGNIEDAVKRLPKFCNDLEILYVEGHSSDGTLDEINRVIEAYPGHDIKVTVQDGRGKGDAVRKGFDMARGDVLIILDADLTVPPEDVPKFYDALKEGKGEYINGTRMVYPMEKEAMRFLNHIANRVFSWLFTWLLNQRYTDTLCGTKVMTKAHYERIAANRKYFGDFDPFGDFDLIFGAAKLNMSTAEIPIRYRSRSYGETQISRFRHGWLLLRMVVFAFFKLKAF